MKSSVTRSFRTRLESLPASVQEQADKAYALWQQPIYSARVSINYRVLGLLEADRIYWYWIGAHDEYDELLKRL
ncbi:MAG: hypothetical protein JGK23_32775 [Microcoleus sp. PH2017_19_SFW_U_A]|nr:hypothetical protein [Microcoleus sp. PH2017_19_SFW_U_A]